MSSRCVFLVPLACTLQNLYSMVCSCYSSTPRSLLSPEIEGFVSDTLKADRIFNFSTAAGLIGLWNGACGDTLEND